MMDRIQRLKSKKGFTMVELIVVIAIIAVLSAIIIPLSMNYLSDSQKASANKSASAIVNAWNIEVNNLALKGTAIVTGVFTYDFANKVADATGVTAPLATDEIEKIMQTTFPNQSKGVAAVQIVSTGGTVACTAAVFSETATIGSSGLTIAGDEFSYGSTTLMTLASTPSTGVIEPAMVGTDGAEPDTGSIVFGYSPQPTSEATPVTST